MTCHSTLPRPDRRKAAGLAVVPPPVGHGTQRRRGDPPALLLRLARFLLDEDCIEVSAVVRVFVPLAGTDR